MEEKHFIKEKHFMKEKHFREKRRKNRTKGAGGSMGEHGRQKKKYSTA